MNINIILDSNNVIIGWQNSPLVEELPLIEIEDPSTIRVGFDKFIDGEIVPQEEAYQASIQRAQKIARIAELKDNLASTADKLNEFMEGDLPEEEWLVIKQQRHLWREEIKLLELQLNVKS